MSYLLTDDHFEHLREGHEKTVKVESALDLRIYLLAAIPAAVVLYFIYQILTTGKF